VTAAHLQHSYGLTRLALSHFRSYEGLLFECMPHSVILTGKNGAGKTNILEAISFLSPGRGLRGINLSQASHIKKDGNIMSSWAVATTLATPYGGVEIGTALEEKGESERRAIHISKQPVKSQAELTQHVNVLWLTPQMDRIFSEGVSSRRRFLDRLVYSFDREHASRVLRYEHVMRERLRLLKSNWRHEEEWVGALEQKMAAEGVALTVARLHTVDALSQAKEWSNGLFPKAHLELVGGCEQDLKKGAALEAEEKLALSLSQSRYADGAVGRTLVGPHRSDLQVTYIEKRMPADQCSTGEQKALLVSIIMAASRLQVLRGGAIPLILLDEVMAHLDEERRQALFAEIESLKVQAWLTGTDPELFKDFMGQTQHFEIVNRTLKRL
jgi:DNA replication and repair protein RecF